MNMFCLKIFYSTNSIVGSDLKWLIMCLNDLGVTKFRRILCFCHWLIFYQTLIWMTIEYDAFGGYSGKCISSLIKQAIRRTIIEYDLI